MNKLLTTLTVVLFLWGNRFIEIKDTPPANIPAWGTWEKWGAQPDGTYYNPILPADYSDLDCIRVGDDYYAITSTFQYQPGMAVLHSKDLVNWDIIGHAVEDIRQIGQELNWDRMNRYNRGIWAGSIRYHDGKFYILFGTPDEGYFTTHAENPAGPWAPLTNILQGPGWNDCSAIWDDDGKAYFIGNCFKTGYENFIFDMAPDCSSIDFDSKRLVFKGDGREASKLIKAGKWYYIIYSRTGGGSRYMVAKRSESMQGPWSDEKQITAPNRESREPNQGGIIEGPDKKWYFFTHHGSGDWEGRAASLLPVTWIDGWPIPGRVGEDGLGYMQWTGKMPAQERNKQKYFYDNFDNTSLNANWEWNYYPRNDRWSLSERKGWLRLKSVKPLRDNDMKKTPNVLTQRVYRSNHNEFTVKMDARKMEEGQIAGLCHYARTYAYIGISCSDGQMQLVFNNNGESQTKDINNAKDVWLRSKWGLDGMNKFSYSTDGINFYDFGIPFQFTWADYRGTRVGLFSFNNKEEKGYVDIDFVEYNYGNVIVHPYAPFVIPNTGQGGVAYPSHVRNDAISTRFGVKVANVNVSAIRYDNSINGNQGHCMDVARFASNSLKPRIEINVMGGDEINSVTIHPVRFYPQEALTISADRRTLTFEMVENLPYAIVIINGDDPQDASTTNPQLTLINDPLEDPTKKPSLTAPNVLNFKTFSEDFLRKNPITDKVGEQCRPAGSVTDASLNDGRQFTWNHEAGQFVDYTSRIVAFPNMRARNPNDVSDALQAALEKIKNTPELNTLYIPAGVYLWSGLRIHNWNGDINKGGKPLFIYTDENALMINRQKECREAIEPAIYIAYSSFITVSGRGMHDGQGCLTFSTDRKDAKNTPHQGGVMLKKSSNLTFTDTYLRDSQQWNWETHDVVDVVLNNIKGLSPYYHGWVDGLNLASGKNVTVNGSITLGNDDVFATGHYNPSNEFPIRTYNENKSINFVNTDANPAEIRNTFAAAGVYNKDRLNWSNDDTENIRVSNAIGWTRTAHCLRAGLNTKTGNPEIDTRGRVLKGFYFDNFHAIVGRNAGGDIRFTNYNTSAYFPVYEKIVIKNSSFWTPGNRWAFVQTAMDNSPMIQNFVMQNLYFVKPIANPSATFSGIANLTVKELYIGGQEQEYPQRAKR